MDRLTDVRTTIREARTGFDEAGLRWSIDAEKDTRECAIREQAKLLNETLTTFTREGDIAENEAMGRAFAMLHRTHQQMFVAQVIVPILQRLAIDSAPNHHDARNWAACQFAVKALAANADTHLPVI